MVKMTLRMLMLATIIVGLRDHSNAEQLPPSGPYVFGYTDQLSYIPGDTVAFHLSSNQPTVDLTISRVGAQTEQVHQEVGVACAAHPIADRASSDGCDWPVAWTLPIPSDWKSGYYEVTVKAGGDAGAQGSLFFVVRAGDSQPKSNILLQLSTNTYNAYTNWGGHSLYSYHDRDGLQGHQVSFDRPIGSQFGKWELPFVRWAETNG